MLLLSLLALSADAQAKDLRSRIGVGLYQPIDIGTKGGSLTMISLRYGLPLAKPTQNLILELDAGFRVDASLAEAGYGGGLRVLYALVVEDNLNFYGSVYGGYQQNFGGDPAARVTPGVGVEFFPFGLDNLGISADIGLNLDFGKDVHFGTAPALGVRYYF